jgi:WD40 repeat protein
MYRRISKTFKIGGAFLLLLLIGVSLSFGLDYREGMNPKGLREAYRLNPFAIQQSPAFPRSFSGTRGIDEAIWFRPAVTGFSVAYSPDGKLIATTGGFGTVLLFNTSDGSLAEVLTGHTGQVRSVAFSPDGNLLASGSWDNTIKLWRVSDGSCINTLTGHTRAVNSVAFSPDGGLLASGSADDTIKIWRVSDGSCINTLTGHTDWVNSVAFSPDGALIASGSRDNTIKIWRVSDGSCINTLTGHTDWVNSVAFSPDGNLLASGSRDWTIKIWNMPDGFCLKTLTGKSAESLAPGVYSVSFSPDGSLLASGSGDDTMRIWNVSDGSCLKTLKCYCWYVLSVSFSPNGTLLASGGWDKTIKIWRVSDGSCIKTLASYTGGILSVAFSPDGGFLASGSYDSTIKIWNVEDGSCMATLTGHTSWVTSVAFCPVGNLLASGSWDGNIKIWSVPNGPCIKTFGFGGFWPVNSIAFSPDGNLLASGHIDYDDKRTLGIWSVPGGSLIKSFIDDWWAHTWQVNSVTFSPDGKLLALGDWDGRICILGVPEGFYLRTLIETKSWVNSVAFSPDGNVFASGHWDKTIKIWRVSDGSCINTLTGHTNLVNSITFSPNGKLIASGSGDWWTFMVSDEEGEIKIWSVSDGCCIKTLIGPLMSVNSVAFSPDGTLLASGGDDGIAIWRMSQILDITPPTIPGNLKAQAVSSSEIDLSWDASTDSGGSGLAGYSIERRTSGGSFSEIAKVDANTTSYKDTGLSAATTYEYRVRAYDKAGNYSDYSNTASATTLESSLAQFIKKKEELMPSLEELYVLNAFLDFWPIAKAGYNEDKAKDLLNNWKSAMPSLDDDKRSEALERLILLEKALKALFYQPSDATPDDAGIPTGEIKGAKTMAKDVVYPLFDAIALCFPLQKAFNGLNQWVNSHPWLPDFIKNHLRGIARHILNAGLDIVIKSVDLVTSHIPQENAQRFFRDLLETGKNWLVLGQDKDLGPAQEIADILAPYGTYGALTCPAIGYLPQTQNSLETAVEKTSSLSHSGSYSQSQEKLKTILISAQEETENRHKIHETVRKASNIVSIIADVGSLAGVISEGTATLIAQVIKGVTIGAYAIEGARNACYLWGIKVPIFNGASLPESAGYVTSSTFNPDSFKSLSTSSLSHLTFSAPNNLLRSHLNTRLRSAINDFEQIKGEVVSAIMNDDIEKLKSLLDDFFLKEEKLNDEFETNFKSLLGQVYQAVQTIQGFDDVLAKTSDDVFKSRWERLQLFGGLWEYLVEYYERGRDLDTIKNEIREQAENVRIANEQAQNQLNEALNLTSSAPSLPVITVTAHQVEDVMLSGRSYEIKVTLSNIGSGSAENITATLQPSPDNCWEITSSPQLAIASLASGDSTELSWSINVSQLMDVKAEPISISLTSSNAISTSFTKVVNFVPAYSYDFSSGVLMLSIPLSPMNTDPAKAFNISPSSFSLATWENSPKPGYRFYDPDNPSSLPISQGKGYFIKFKHSGSLRVGGIKLTAGQVYPIHLSAGWNLIGVPYDSTISWDTEKIKVRHNGEEISLKEASERGWIGKFAWGWRKDDNSYVLICEENIPNTKQNLEPWQGYWVKAKVDCDLILPIEQKEKKQRSGKSGWIIPISLQSNYGKDDFNLFGVIPGGLTASSPPAFPGADGMPNLSFLSSAGEQLAVDLREKEENFMVWRFYVEGREGEEMWLSWRNMSSLPRGVQAILVDESNGKKIYMNTTNIYKFTSNGRRYFRIEVGREIVPPLLIGELNLNNSRGGLSISFNLSINARVNLKIRSLQGKVLKEMVSEGRQGLNSLYLDSKGVPAGVYIIELIAKSELNQIARAIRMVNLR